MKVIKENITVADLIKELKKFDQNAKVHCMGFEQGRCNDWEGWHSDVIKLELDPEDPENILYLEGVLYND